ncbi:carboxymuconolactone decarboxylase family protein [Aestuariicella hydrocarbonica]|uniref:Carboxymuconolactone decarboxylase family protein n=1 Tax=Pseudomaricurvus hydrocarbonicus TaxID=1470433 RepID=A0A9E5JWC6_9GAMM|nr:carboxymuconolactone decarboxylase family protein [Aestuariicella hydrocarbonica]NHO66706.1 carboxymuconolactone decarboxylase family protein [Aestuariicella hydrocarbonica]
MPRITPVNIEDLPLALGAGIAHARNSGVLSTPVPVQVWAHRPPLAQAWLATLQTFHDHALLSERERELIRLKIASVTQCQACQLARKSETISEEDIACLSTDDARFTTRESAALDFAGKFAGDYMAIDDVSYIQLQNHFSTAEIVELNMYCALMLAGGRMTYVQEAYE